jgi:hypothetical protein
MTPRAAARRAWGVVRQPLTVAGLPPACVWRHTARMGKQRSRRDRGQKTARPRESATELAESFRKASKSLEAVTREVTALRRRLTKPTAR